MLESYNLLNYKLIPYEANKNKITFNDFIGNDKAKEMVVKKLFILIN